jgi:hypothetical protein
MGMKQELPAQLHSTNIEVYAAHMHTHINGKP